MSLFPLGAGKGLLAVAVGAGRPQKQQWQEEGGEMYGELASDASPTAQG